MFKALEVWMEELEKEFYDDYMRARKALNDWKDALTARRLASTIDIWRIRDELRGEYRGYSCLKVTPKFREEDFTYNGNQFIALIDVVTVDGIDYDVVMAFCNPKDAENKAEWRTHYNAEDKCKATISADSGWGTYLARRRAYEADAKLVEGRDEQWIAERAHKDMLKHKKSIEDKIAKICDKIDSVWDEYSEYYVKGTNGRVAHLWRIMAGGYNIQRLHTRVLCKEVKQK
jgi:hypothetical protein